MQFERVSVVGLGYIGLPTAAVLASRKLNVIGVDVNADVVDTINQGRIHIVEPDLDMVVRASVNEGYLRATTVPEPADAFLIAVPTPFKDGHEPDLRFIEAAARTIAPVLEPGNLVILESTSPVGTPEQMAAWLATERPDLSFPQTHGEDAQIRIAHCPERVLPGQILRELVQNDRVIGGMTPRCSQAAINLYKHFVKAEFVVTNARTAELCKLTENSFRDVNIAFANELSIICSQLDIDVWELIRLANRHPRVNILQPGTGVGGHCIAVDPWFIVSQAPEQARLIRTAREINDHKPAFVIEQIAREAAERGTKQVICLGATFKPDIDDLRESPAVEVLQGLVARGLQVDVVEPNVPNLEAKLGVSCVRQIGLTAALSRAESSVLAILVAHQEFKACSKLGDVDALDFCGARQATRR